LQGFSVANLEQSFSKAKEDLLQAENAPGIAREAVLAWTQAIDSVLIAMDVYQQSYRAQQHKSATWEQLRLATLDRLCAQEECLEKNMKLCTTLVSHADATELSAKLALAQSEQQLKEEMAKSDAEFSRVYDAVAADGDFVTCARLHDQRADALSANREISLLQNALDQSDEEVLRCGADKMRAEANQAYWTSLLVLFRVTEQQYCEQAKVKGSATRGQLY
jgi:hypothetical protein